MDGGVADIPPGGNASFWVNPPAGWEWTANLYNLGGYGANVAGGGDPLCTPHVTVTNATLYKGNATWPAPGHFNWYQILNPTGNITVTVTFKAKLYTINLVTASDPPGLNVPGFAMDGGVTTIYHNQGRSFWVQSDATQTGLPWEAFQATTDQYNLGAWDWPPNSPDYADGGDPLCTPRVTVANAKLYKGNAAWPVANHFDWYNVYGATGDVTITATHKPRDIPVSYGSYITGPAVVYHEYTGHSIVVTPAVRTGYTLTGMSTTSGAATDLGNGTWRISTVTNLSGITVSASYTLNTYTVTFDLNGGIYQGGGALSQVVTHGADATLPNDPKRCDYAFNGWSGAWTNVTSNRTITATWISDPCDDDDACTDDYCDPLVGDCVHTPIVCNDSDPCTLDTCNPLTGCVFTPKNCDDGVACTIDSCDPMTGNCIHTPDNGLCNDGDPCTIDTCDPLSDCVFTPKNCDDGVACTIDSCNPMTGDCIHTPDNASCNDSDPCTIDTCDPLSGCIFTPKNCDDGVACTLDSCDPVTGACIHTPDNALCNDSDPCTIDTCNPLSGCVFTPKNCNDGVACTIDSCDPMTGACIHTADNGLCNDSDPCTVDTCNPLSGCVFTPKNCDDADPCTEDSCEPINGECIHTGICEGEGEPPLEGEGEPPVEGEGEPPVEGEGEPPVEGEGEPPVEGEGEPPVEGEGEPPAEGEGEPPVGLEVTAGQTYFLIPEGNSVSFEIFVSGAQGSPSFQWYRHTPDKALTIIPDATDAVYTIAEVALEDAGEYQCEVYDDILAETAWSPMFTLAIGSGVPVAGLAGLAAALALTGLGSALAMRRRRQ